MVANDAVVANEAEIALFAQLAVPVNVPTTEPVSEPVILPETFSDPVTSNPFGKLIYPVNELAVAAVVALVAKELETAFVAQLAVPNNDEDIWVATNRCVVTSPEALMENLVIPCVPTSNNTKFDCSVEPDIWGCTRKPVNCPVDASLALNSVIMFSADMDADEFHRNVLESPILPSIRTILIVASPLPVNPGVRPRMVPPIPNPVL